MYIVAFRLYVGIWVGGRVRDSRVEIWARIRVWICICRSELNFEVLFFLKEN